MSTNNSILFKNAVIVTVNQNNTVVTNGYLGVKSDKITYISDVEPTEKYDKVIDAKQNVLMPGLINCHTHIPMVALRGFADDYNLQTWLNEYIFKAEAKLDAKCIGIASRLAIYEMLSTGTTCFNDMYFNIDTIANEVLNLGIKANLVNGSLCFADKYVPEEDNAFKEFNMIHNKYNNQLIGDGRIKIDAGIHGEYTSFDELWQFWNNIASRNKLNIHVHVSETLKEHEDCKNRYNNKTPVEVLNEYGLFSNNMILAHCVHVEDKDLDIIAKNGASVAHNPVSNLKLGSGIANIQKMMRKGINVCLGTDGVASNNTLDLFEELKLSALLAKGISNNPEAVTANEALKMATINGAKALNRDDEIGSLEIGKKADIIMIDFNNINHIPTYDYTSAICYNTTGKDVVMTMVDGKILYDNGKLLNFDLELEKDNLNSYVVPKILNKD